MQDYGEPSAGGATVEEQGRGPADRVRDVPAAVLVGALAQREQDGREEEEAGQGSCGCQQHHRP